MYKEEKAVTFHVTIIEVASFAFFYSDAYNPVISCLSFQHITLLAYLCSVLYFKVLFFYSMLFSSLCWRFKRFIRVE